MNDKDRVLIESAGFSIVKQSENGYRLRFDKDGTLFDAMTDYKPAGMPWLQYVVWLYGCACRVADEDDGR